MQNLPKFGATWKHFAIMGLTSNALPFALLSWGQQYIDSALAAILSGTTPLFTIVLAHLFTTDDRLTAALYLLPLSLIFEQPYTLALPSWPATGSLLALAVVSTALAFVLYYRYLRAAMP